MPSPLASPRSLVRRHVHIPSADRPTGRLVELPGRGSTYVVDVPGPTPDAPTVLLLHALGCTGLLTWFPSIAPLSERYRVVTFDQRWHGQGIQSDEFSLYDCADDAAAVIETLGLERVMIGGYSMGSVVAQRVWRQHPDLAGGLILAATTDHFRGNTRERAFHAATEAAMLASRGIARSRTAARLARLAGAAVDPEGDADAHDWALAEFRSTSPWAVGQALAALGRHHSRPWLRKIDVPTAVVVLRQDNVIPPDRQLRLASSIPGATIHDIPAGHAACVLQSDVFVPAFVEAVNTVNARRAARERNSA